MDKEPAEEVKEKEVLICRCEEVSLADIEAAIDEGFITVDDVKRRTRAGMGLCQGRTCGKQVALIISKRTGIPLEQLLPSTARSPVRPEKMGIFEGEPDA